MRTNVAPPKPVLRTHEGGKAVRQPPLVELERAVATCLLWENTFYEAGNDIAARIASLCDQVDLEDIGALAVTARNDWKLRHVPLWLCVQMARINSARKLGSDVVSQTIFHVVQRPDEASELLAIYWKGGKRSVPAQIKRGLAWAFTRWDAYQLGKWNRDGAVKLRDALFLCHAEPETEEQALLWKQLVDGTLPTPDTWEVALSSGADKKATWERLIREERLPFMALLMNLRNISEAGVDSRLVEPYLKALAPDSKALPFRFVSAAKHAPAYAQTLSEAMCSVIHGSLDGETWVVVDVSGSMDAAISKRSELRRWEAAGALAILIGQMGPCRVFTFSDAVIEVPNYRGLPLLAGIEGSQFHSGTYLQAALQGLAKVGTPDRLVVITDEQAHCGTCACWAKRGYLINVAPYKPGLDTKYGWQRISGWSERVVDWMRISEGVSVNVNEEVEEIA